MDVLLGVLLGVVLTASALAISRLAAPRRVLAPGEEGVRSALHAAAATLPHLRRGLTRESAGKAIGHLHALTQAEGVLIDAGGAVLAVDGLPAPGGWLPESERVTVVSGPEPYGHTVVAPLVVQGERIGRLAAFYGPERRLRPEDTRVVSEVASLVSAQVELSTLAAQEERLAQAELRALRAQISPHFIYNALAAVANSIHTRPEEARELLTEFAEFTRYAFRGNRSYVTLADELHYVEKYLRLEQARFGDRLEVRVSVAPEVLTAVVPVLSMQPLVENAVRHGVESAAGPCRIEILGADLDTDVELTVKDGGAGMSAEEAAAALAGRGAGIGLANVHARLQSTFGPEYGLRGGVRARRGHGGPHARAEVPRGGPGGSDAARPRRRRRAPRARRPRARPARAAGGGGGVDGGVGRGGAARARGRRALRRGLPRRAHAGPGRRRARARAAALREPARADLRVRVRVGGGRGLRAARARLPAQAGLAARGWPRRSRAWSNEPADAMETLAVDVPGGGTRLVRREDVLYLQSHGDYVRVVTAGRALSACAARWARSSAAGSRTASTACTAATSSTWAGRRRSARSSTAPRC